LSAAGDPARLTVERRPDGIVQATLNRPEAKNAVSFEMWQAFAALLDELEQQTPARALVLTGAGGFFCIGGDLKIPPARGEGALAPATRLEWGQRIIARLMRLPIPVIAAIEGGAFGIGWSLALASDLIIAADNAKFGAPFVDFGLNPDGGAAWFLTQRVGRHKAAELLFSGRTIDAAEAQALGLASRLSLPGAALADALALAGALGKGNRHAVELTKRLLHQSESSDLGGAHAMELAYCAILQEGDELARARAAFAAASAARKKD
jgi:enoyl-CoA hydratase/carnithine racemase